MVEGKLTHHRMDGETDSARRGFENYLEWFPMGTKPSLNRWARYERARKELEKNGVEKPSTKAIKTYAKDLPHIGTPGHVIKWSSKNKWRERRALRDAEEYKDSIRRTQETRARQNEALVAAAYSKLIEKVLNGDLSAADLIRAVKLTQSEDRVRAMLQRLSTDDPVAKAHSTEMIDAFRVLEEMEYEEDYDDDDNSGR